MTIANRFLLHKFYLINDCNPKHDPSCLSDCQFVSLSVAGYAERQFNNADSIIEFKSYNKELT